MKPPNEKGALLHAPIPKSATPHYHRSKAGQVCFQHWQCEATRLFREYWRTADQKHLRAFCSHVIAMRAHEARPAQ
jgi:hypothetical protein